MEDYERVLLVKQEVFVYKIPPRTTNRGVRAADWKLDCPDWTGRMRLVATAKECFMKLEDKMTGELFAKCPIDKYPSIAIEAVTDSSRYFVVRLQDDGGRAAFIGIGFSDRGDSFDLNVALQDHFKWLQKNEETGTEGNKSESAPKLNLGFKEGETITINMNIGNKSSKSKPKTGTPGGLGFGLLPPPPGSNKVPGPPSAKNSPPAPSPTGPEAPSIVDGASNLDLLCDLNSSSSPANLGAASAVPPPPSKGDLWGEFETATEPSNTSALPAQGNWVHF